MPVSRLRLLSVNSNPLRSSICKLSIELVKKLLHLFMDFRNLVTIWWVHKQLHCSINENLLVSLCFTYWSRHFKFSFLAGPARSSSVGIASRYWLDGRGSNPGGSEIFRSSSHRLWGLLYSGYWVYSGGNRAEACRWPPTPSNAEVDKRVELYLNSTPGASLPFVGWTLPLPLPLPLLNSLNRTGRLP